MFTISLLIQVQDNDILSWFFIRTDNDDNDFVVHNDKVCVHLFGIIDDDNGDDSDYDDSNGKDDGDDDDVKDADLKFVKKFTRPDFCAKSFTH